MEEGFRATADLIALDWLPGSQPRCSRGDENENTLDL